MAKDYQTTDRDAPEAEWKAVHRVADHYRGRLESAIRRSFRADVSTAVLEKAVKQQDGSAIRTEVDSVLTPAFAALEVKLAALFLKILEEAGNATARPARPTNRSASDFRTADLGINFNKANPEAILWSQAHAAALVKGIDSETRSAINAAITRGFSQGIAPPETAKVIASSLFLNEQQAGAIHTTMGRMKNPKNWGKTLKAGPMKIRVPKAGPSTEQLTKTATTLGNKYRLRRASVIARNETMIASNEGQRQMWLQAVDKGILSPMSIRQWITTPDDRTCPVCRPLDKREAPLRGPYAGTTFMGPPAHVLCRCAQAISRVPARAMPATPLPTFRTSYLSFKRVYREK